MSTAQQLVDSMDVEEKTTPMEVEAKVEAKADEAVGLDEEVNTRVYKIYVAISPPIMPVRNDETAAEWQLVLAEYNDKLEAATIHNDRSERVPFTAAMMNQSKVWKAAIESDKDADEIPIYCDRATTDVLKWIAEFLAYHSKPGQECKDEELVKPFKSDVMAENILNEWDRNFFDRVMKLKEFRDNENFVAKPNLYRLADTSNYLDIHHLTQLSSARIAALIVGLEPAKILIKIKVELPLDCLPKTEETPAAAVASAAASD